MDMGTYLIVCPLVFLAGFVDSVAGGGGTISLPAYLMAGIPAHLAAGTNKVVNGCGTLIATAKYFQNGKVRLRAAVAAALGAFAGSAAGAQLASMISESALKTIMLIALPCVALFLVVRRDFGGDGTPVTGIAAGRELLISALIGLGIGCGLCMLSYYSAYIYCLASLILYFVNRAMKKEKVSDILLKALFIIIIAFLIAG